MKAELQSQDDPGLICRNVCDNCVSQVHGCDFLMLWFIHRTGFINPIDSCCNSIVPGDSLVLGGNRIDIFFISDPE